MKVVCSICGREINGREGFDYYVTDDGEIVGHFCCCSILRRCGCGRLIKKDKPRCNDCEERIYSNHINGYCTKPVGVFKNYKLDTTKPINHTRYYGIEMEYNNCDYHIVWDRGERKKLYTDKWLYNKTDSSIRNGVEIVTSPMDRKSVNKLLDNMVNIFEYVKECSEHTNNAGIHIHVTRKSISIPDVYKIAMLLNNSEYVDEYSKRLLYYLSGRLPEPSLETTFSYSYCSVANNDRLRSMSTGHNVAFNTYNHNTLEFRIFKSTADVEVIKSYVELVDKIIEFCHTHGIRSITINNFIMWLKDNTKNKIILNRIKEFEDALGEVGAVSRNFSYNIYELIRGIKWYAYPRLIYSLNDNSNIRDAVKKRNAYVNLVPKYFSGRNKEVIDKLINTVRKASIYYILNNQERINVECA